MTPAQYAAHQARVKSARTVKFEGNQGEKKRGPETAEVAKPSRKVWDYEARLAQQLEDAGMSGFFVDEEYIEGRGLRADILFPLHKLCVEIQGAVHRVKAQWERDILKAQATLLEGYWLLPIATKQVRDGSAVAIIRRALDTVTK